MIEMKIDCVTLDDVAFSGELGTCRWFRPRTIYPYWSESWLRQAEEGSAASSPGRAGHRTAVGHRGV